MLHCQARSPARYTSNGDFVPLDQQDTSLWLGQTIDEAEKHLLFASTFKHLGRNQLEAAIQSIHANRAKTGQTDWQEIALLYEGLTRIAPGIGALVGRAVALAESGKPDAGLAALNELEANRIGNYQPYWAARGHLLHLLNRQSEANEAITRAAGLTDDPAMRKHLFNRCTDI
jgi:RNA polymerase sigma-70 factor (ECF subfamily)